MPDAGVFGERPDRIGQRLTPGVIAGIYCIVGITWILTTDRLLEVMLEDPESMPVLQSVKGGLYVLVTALLLYLLVRKGMSALRRSGEVIRAREAQFRALADHSPMGIWQVRPNGETVYANVQMLNLLGIETLAELRAADPWEFFSPEDAERLRERLALRQGVIETDLELTLRPHRHEPRTVLVSIVPLRDGEGETATLIGSFVDITERRRAEDELVQLAGELEDRVRQRTEELERANRDLEAFTYSVSHDLRAPLRHVNGFAKILQQEHADQLDAEGQRLLGTVRDAASRMGALIEDLLRLSRLGRAELRIERCDMRAMAEAAAAQAVDARPEGAARPSVRIGELEGAEGDEALLRQVWENLLSNAVKYSSTRDSPEVEVWSEQRDGDLWYVVRDNGVGFDPAYTDKLFGVFQRLHRAEEFPGTGVGLAIVLRIVQMHGGEVVGEGRLGEGALFRFRLGETSCERSTS